MKTDILATLATLTDQINALPDDPPAPTPAPTPAPPNTPTNFAILNEYGDNPHQVDFGWDNPGDGNAFRLQYKGAPGSPLGPDDWTDIPTSGPGANNICAELSIADPDGQSLLFQLFSVQTGTGVQSVPATLTWTSPNPADTMKRYTIPLLILASALLSACATKPLDPALLAGHQAFTSKLTLPQ